MSHRPEVATFDDFPPSPEALERRLRDADPRVRLIAPRVLRRLHRSISGSGLLGGGGSGRPWLAVTARVALEHAAPDELGLDLDPLREIAADEALILLPRPEAEELAARPIRDILAWGWRRIFAARVQIALDRARLDERTLSRRVAALGIDAFDEVRAVLHHDRLISDPDDTAGVYRAFAPFYLERMHFAPGELPDHFPTLPEPDLVAGVLALDIDPAAELAASRPPGAPSVPPRAPDPDVLPERVEDAVDPGPIPDEAGGPPGSRYRRLMQTMRRADAAGNRVRAAISGIRAARLLPAEFRAGPRREAIRSLDLLAIDLAAALDAPEGEARLWSRALELLLDRAARGLWVPEARILYDLQKIALERGRTIYRVDLVAWALSGGRRPLRRPLPLHHHVLRVQHLRSALRRLVRVGRLPEAGVERLGRLLEQALDRAAENLRAAFREPLRQTLDARGWTARNIPEAVARHRLEEELLDRVVAAGFIALGDFRDAVARSDLKLPDLAGPSELIRGDRLLRTDRSLAISLDGVYRRGEFYLRWLQRGSAVCFGTRAGRALTLLAILPILGSFVILKGLDALNDEIAHVFHHHPVHVLNRASFIALALFLLGLINSHTFRRGTRWGLRRIGQGLRWALILVPSRVLKLPAVRAILESPILGGLARSAVGPMASALATYEILRVLTVHRQDAGLMAIVAAVLAFLLLNSRPGRDIEEIVAERATLAVRRFLTAFLPALFRFVMDFFAALVEGVERAIYTIDEWLRFRSGQGRAALIGKAVLGAIWGGIRYVVRFVVNLVAEPQLNPIKHFPVVSVSHKVMFPMLLAARIWMLGPPLSLPPMLADAIAVALQFVGPGICGFLVWELKENWRLYDANRAPGLTPSRIGSHGETAGRLLRRGFHSGTIPRLFARLRKTERRTPDTHQRARVQRIRESLHHASESVRHFAERDLLDLLDQTRAFRGGRLGAEAVRLGVASFEIDLVDREHPGRPIRLRFAEQGGRLTARVADPGPLSSWDEAERATLADALAGWYRRGGVEIALDRAEAVFDLSRVEVRAIAAGLRVTPRHEPGQTAASALYPLSRADETERLSPIEGRGPAVPSDRLVFAVASLPWTTWVRTWDEDRVKPDHPARLDASADILPINA
jgi:hypothetical protein